MALSSVSVVVSSLLLNLYTPPGAPAWHQNVIRRVNLALKSRRLMRFNRVRECRARTSGSTAMFLKPLIVPCR